MTTSELFNDIGVQLVALQDKYEKEVNAFNQTIQELEDTITNLETQIDDLYGQIDTLQENI